MTLTWKITQLDENVSADKEQLTRNEISQERMRRLHLLSSQAEGKKMPDGFPSGFLNEERGGLVVSPVASRSARTRTGCSAAGSRRAPFSCLASLYLIGL